MVAEERDLAGVVHDFGELVAAHLAAFLVVGGDEADEVFAGFAFEGGVDDDDRNLLRHRRADGADERGVVERGEDDAVDAFRDELFDDGNLLGAVVFLERTFPDDLDAEFFAGILGAGFDGLPEDVRRAFGDDSDLEWFVVGVGDGREGENECEQLDRKSTRLNSSHRT
mgnify:CR=1 FL=1